jgi:hypothetical protein
MAEVLRSSRRHGLRWSLADVVIDPWRPGSAAGVVRGGIRGFASMPGYFHERRLEQGRKRTMNRKPPPGFRGSPVERWDQLAYYLGPLHRHFGHAIVESATRLWFYQEARSLLAHGASLPLVLMPPADGPEHLRHYEAGDLSDWQRSLLDLYGVPIQDLRFVRTPLRCRRLIVPEQAWLWGGRPTTEAAAAYVPMQPPAGSQERQERIWLVRGQEYFQRGAVAGVRVIRDFFGAHGYRLLDPVTLGLPEQVALMRGASHVFGVQGSAFHLFNLAGNSSVRAGCLGRVGTLASRGFVNSVEPFVGALLLKRPDGSDPSPDPARSATKFRLALHRDVPRLLEFLTRFDPDLQPGRFDVQAYSRAVEADREAFGHGGKAS